MVPVAYFSGVSALEPPLVAGVRLVSVNTGTVRVRAAGPWPGRGI